jgi:hypothetical protein
MTFLGQVCFADSKDIIGGLPGDVLLLFGKASFSSYSGWGPAAWDPDSQELIYLEWQRLDLSDPLAAKDCPETPWKIDELFGIIHRTVDYPEVEPWLKEEQEETHLPTVLSGTKIGGVPSWNQGPEELPGKLVCMLGSVSPISEVPFPFVNQEEPESSDSCYEKTRHNKYLLFGDMGCLYVFYDEVSGKTSWTIQ